MKRISWMFFISLALGVSAHAASFDCAKANTKVEKMICEPNTSLKQKDEDLDSAYQWALMRVENKQQVTSEQKHWLKTVRNVCEDIGCLLRAYDARLDELAEQARNKGCYVLMPLYDGGLRGNVRPIEPVCLALEKNLNQFCDQPPMACGLKVAPEFRDKIILPIWTPLDPVANRALIEEFIRAPWDELHFTQQAISELWEENRKNIKKALAEKRLTLSQAKLDLYNLGEAQTAYRLGYGDCETNNPQFGDRTKWDEAIHYSSIQIQYAPEVVRALFKQYFLLDDSTMPEVFLYDGKVYDFAMWGKDRVIGETVPGEYEPPADNWLWVMRHERWMNPINKKINLHKDSICKFNYQPTQGE